MHLWFDALRPMGIDAFTLSGFDQATWLLATTSGSVLRVPTACTAFAVTITEPWRLEWWKVLPAAKFH